MRGNSSNLSLNNLWSPSKLIDEESNPNKENSVPKELQNNTKQI